MRAQARAAALIDFSPRGHVMFMPLLVVDDRDGRVVAELERQEDAVRVLEALAREDTNVSQRYCLVELSSRHGAIVGTDTSIKIRLLP